MRKMIGLALVLSFFATIAVAQTKFCETGGIVSMEAENANKIVGWKLVAGLSGPALEDNSAQNAGYMEYEITFTSTGKFYVFILARYTGGSSADNNDAFVTMDGNKLYASDDKTRPDGMRTHCSNFCWRSLPKGPGSHTPELIKYNPVYAKVSTTGKHIFKVTSRSMGFVLDKIVLKLADTTPPAAGTGPDETTCVPTDVGGITIEAEDMTLDGKYKVDNGAKLNGSGITLDATLPRPVTGTATYTYTGASGSYKIKLTIIPEQDGAPMVKMFAGSQEIINEVYPEHQTYFTLEARVEFEATGVTLNSGDVIKIEGTSAFTTGFAGARVDKFEIIPEGPTFLSIRPNGRSEPQLLQHFPHPMTDKAMFLVNGIQPLGNNFIIIHNSTGIIVRKIQTSHYTTHYEWDGRDEHGFMVQPGMYVFMVNGMAVSGKILKMR